MNHEIERIVKEMQVIINSVNINNYKVIDETYGRDYLTLEITLDIFSPDQFIKIGQDLKRLHEEYKALRLVEIEENREKRRDNDLGNELFPGSFL